MSLSDVQIEALQAGPSGGGSRAIYFGAGRAWPLSAMTAPAQPASPLLLALCLFTYIISMVVKSPALTEFFQHRLCVIEYPNAAPDSPLCNNGHITGLAAKWMLYATVAQVTPAVVVATAMGALSDRYGRKSSLVLAASAGLVEAAVIVAVQASGASLWFIVGGEVLVGCMGASSLFFMATFSMTIDSIPRSKRTLYIGLLEGAIYFGMVTGYIGGGLVTRYYGYFTIFVTMQVLFSLSVLLSVVCTETLVPEMRQRHVGWKQANLWAAVAVLGRNRNVAILAGVFVLQIATRMGVAGVAILYVRHMFNWKADKVTYYLALDSACKGLALLVTIPLVEWLLPRRSFFRQDLTLIRAGLFFGAIYFVIPFAIQREDALWAITGLGIISGLPVPVIRSAISKYINDTEQGKTMAALAAVESLAGLLAPLIFNQVYPATIHAMPSATFGVGCGLALLGLCAMFTVQPPPEDTFAPGLASIQDAVDTPDRRNGPTRRADERRALLSPVIDPAF